ncbi:hypothetical protein HPP92_004503 [Vanilla planifolia]|uniref:Uncharacterized protein n=1 Tax=Vanilla planifolia TaxID=51239 RepID=A0A835S961_VANPL|nr:hypothetical protein HPP92_004503 [Vanilla planifolia]
MLGGPAHIESKERQATRRQRGRRGFEDESAEVVVGWRRQRIRPEPAVVARRATEIDS